jgi:phosphoenolpyruvate carboxylase
MRRILPAGLRGGRFGTVGTERSAGHSLCGAWSQLKQNVTGYYGVGKALQEMDKRGNWAAVKQLYENSLFFRTLLDNCEMAMKKCFFPLTEHFSQHPVYGEIWTMIYDEFELTKKYILSCRGRMN